MQLSYLFVTTSLFISIFSGYFLIKEHEKISFNQLDQNQKVYVFMLIYSNVYLLFFTGLILLSEIWYKMILCSNENNTIYSFGLFKMLFILSGFASILYLFVHQCRYDDYINNQIDTCSWLLIGNMFFMLGISLIYKCIITKNKKKYNNIQHDDNEILLKPSEF